MRRISCHECKKTYNYDLNDFCPRCGAYTPPKKHLRFDGRGRIVRLDGINEQNCQGSFVHAERHQEEKQRRQVGLSKTASAAAAPAFTARQGGSKKAAQSSQKKNVPLGIIAFVAYLLYMLLRIDM